MWLVVLDLAVPDVFSPSEVVLQLAKGGPALKSDLVDLLEDFIGGVGVVAVARFEAVDFKPAKSLVMEFDFIVNNHWVLDSSTGAEVFP